MNYAMDRAGAARVTEYFELIGQHLPRETQRNSFAVYAFGILGDGERKSVEPIAARAAADEEGTCRLHDSLLHFIRESPWDDRAVRRQATRYVVGALSAREAITTWIIDDTGFIKQGKHSPGVQRQYTGSAGKICNCQIGVSLSIATRTEQVPIDFELYLPESWTEDRVRREAARIPDDIAFKTKTELAQDLLRRAKNNRVPGDVVLADAWYGRSHEFRETIRALGLDYAVAVDPTKVRVGLLDARERRRGEPRLAADIGAGLESKTFGRITWREGTRGQKLASRFCFRRVKVAREDGTDPTEREPSWLIVEWPEGESKPTKFFLTTLRRRMSKKQIIRTMMERWKTERVYEELKGELGLDHYEGRSFVGWHHHVSVVLCCYAFVVAERVRAFPPSARGTRRYHALRVAA
jgi:SRSO17 transposase